MGPLSHSASSTSSGHIHNVDLFGTINILLKREESVEIVLKPTWPGLPRWCCLWLLCSQIAGSWCSGCCCCCCCCWSCCWCSLQRQRWWKSFRQTSGEQAEIIYHKSLFCRHSLLVPFHKLFQNFCTPMLLLEEEKSITKCVQAWVSFAPAADWHPGLTPPPRGR